MDSAKGKPLVIVYHDDCVDGAACAWAVAKAHGADKGKHDNVTYIPYAHHDKGKAEDKIRAALQEDATLYFVDVAPTKEFLDEMMTPGKDGKAKVRQVNVMDHHESQTRALEGYAPPDVEGGQPALELLIDPNLHSAAKMVWQELLPDEPPPPVLDVINLMDGDAKGLKTPQDFAAAALIDTKDISTPERAFETLRGLAKETFNEMAMAGRPLVEDQQAKIDWLLKNAQTIEMQILPDQPPVKVAIVNADVKQFGRQISARLVEEGQKAGSGVAFAWHMQKNGAVTMSIRTDGEPDASKIADYLRDTMGVTGGGHDGAGAVHFASLFHFAAEMPFRNAKPLHKHAIIPPAKQPPRHENRPPLH